MKPQPVIRDERSLAVENSSYRWAYFLLAFGLLVIVAYRGFVGHESNWDLLALVILSGVVTSLYQGVNRVLSQRWVWVAIITTIVAVIIAVALALLR